MFAKKIKNSILILFLAVLYAGNAQQFYFETGVSNAFFKDYVNDSGENTLDLDYSKPIEPMFGGGFRFNIYKERIRLNIGSNYSKYKIKTGFYSGNISIPLTYNLSYFSIKTGVNFTVIRWKKLDFQIHSHISHNWVVSGTSKYRDTVIDLYKEDTFDKTLFRYHFGIGLEYEISKNLSTYVSYDLGNSIVESNRDSNQGESYNLRTNSLSFGLLFSIEKKEDKKIENIENESE